MSLGREYIIWKANVPVLPQKREGITVSVSDGHCYRCWGNSDYGISKILQPISLLGHCFGTYFKLSRIYQK